MLTLIPFTYNKNSGEGSLAPTLLNTFQVGTNCPPRYTINTNGINVSMVKCGAFLNIHIILILDQSVIELGINDTIFFRIDDSSVQCKENVIHQKIIRDV